MADGVAITPGVGRTVLTDETPEGHAQGVKLAISANASSALIPADATNGLDVDVTRVPSASSATIAQVASSATSVTLQASNSSRKGLSIFNDSTAVLYVKFGSAASATSFTVKVGAGEFYEMAVAPVYTGLVAGVWASANGFGYVTEV